MSPLVGAVYSGWYASVKGITFSMPAPKEDVPGSRNREYSRFENAVKHLLSVKPADVKDEPKAKHPKRKRRGKPGHT